MQETIFKRNWPFDLKKNNLVTELPYIGKEYKISFDLFVTKFGAEDYQSVIHFTTSGNAEKYGDRTPGVWMCKTKKLHISSALNGNVNNFYDDPTVQEEQKWINVEISQTLMDNKV